MTRFLPVSSNSFSRDMQAADALSFLELNYPDAYADVVCQFPEVLDAVWVGAWFDTDAMCVDPDWSSWLVDAIEATGRVRWEDGEPYGAEPPAGPIWRAFLSGYVECALWADTWVEDPDTGDADRVDGQESELSPKALATLTADARDFYMANGPMLGAFTRHMRRPSGWTHAHSQMSEVDAYAHAGHDLWLTRNGHGAGFWDRGAGAVGDYLSDMARPLGEQSLYFGDDGRIYMM